MMSEILRRVSHGLILMVSFVMFVFPAHSAKEVNIFDNTDLFAGPSFPAANKRQSVRYTRAVVGTKKRRAVKRRYVPKRKRHIATVKPVYTVSRRFPRGFTAKATRRERKQARKVPKKHIRSRVSGRSRFSSLIAKHASNNGVPVSLAHAVVSIESNYRPGIRGGAGEIGLMQIKPATARMMGFRGSTKALYNPDTNLKYGMKYLAGAYRMSGGTVCGTVLRYNAGHGARRMNPISARYCRKAKRILGR